MAELKTVFSHSPSVVTTKTGKEYVLVPVSNDIADMNSMFTLNETGAFIWEQIDGKKSVEEIINELTGEYDVEYTIALEDVIAFCDEMSKYLVINK
jgi:methyltransferase-like protein